MVSTSTYDAENRLTAMTGGITASYVYDGDGNRVKETIAGVTRVFVCLLYTSPSPRDRTRYRMPSSA